MPTILTHAVVPLAIGLGLGRGLVPARLLAAGVAASILPDADVLAFRLGIAYSHELGHRGFSHSIAFALLLGLAAMACCHALRSTRDRAFGFVFLAALSHGLLDSLTSGGMGVALLWPLSDARFFAPWQVIRVSPLSLQQILGPRGAVVLASEFQWVWLPGALVGLLLAAGGRLRRTQASAARPH